MYQCYRYVHVEKNQLKLNILRQVDEACSFFILHRGNAASLCLNSEDMTSQFSATLRILVVFRWKYQIKVFVYQTQIK